MPKNEKFKTADQAKVNEKLLKEILAELKETKGKLRRLSHVQKKTAVSLEKLKTSLADCRCCNGKKKKPKKKKNSKKSAERNELQAMNLANVLNEPRGGMPDDLKWISGVGPKLEETLNGLGVFHFEQIAAWTQREIDWVDDYLKFSGRIERDNWIEQAKALAKGGWDEYVKVFGKEPR